MPRSGSIDPGCDIWRPGDVRAHRRHAGQVRGSLSGPDSGRPVGGTLEPRRRGVGFLGLEANWPGILLMAIGAVLLTLGASF
jgi:hypothetical protein